MLFVGQVPLLDPASLVSSVLAAAETGGSSVDISGLFGPIAALGIGGILFLMLAFQIGIVSKKSHDQMQARYDKEIEGKDEQIKDLNEANRSLRTLTEEQIIPALVRANQLAADYASDLADERRARRRKDSTGDD